MADLYRTKTQYNTSDVGTQPDKVTLKDVGPDSRWEQGDQWMKLDLVEVIAQGLIKPAAKLRMKPEQEDEYKKGLLYEKVPEILTRGHVVNTKRVEKIEERAEFQVTWFCLPSLPFLQL